MSTKNPVVGIVMGSDSDLPVMRAAVDVLNEFNIPHEVTVVSAHRTPNRMYAYAAGAHARGIKVIIAGAGGAAHLPGMLASLCPLPIIGVPIKSSNSIDGWDSILSILQMPNGIPVATVALNASKNAALLAIRMLGIESPSIYEAMEHYQKNLVDEVQTKIDKLKSDGLPNNFD